MNHFGNEIRPPCNILGYLRRVKKFIGHMFVQIQDNDSAPLFHTSLKSIRNSLLTMDTLAVSDFSVD